MELAATGLGGRAWSPGAFLLNLDETLEAPAGFLEMEPLTSER